jgi:hypothetical protein
MLSLIVGPTTLLCVPYFFRLRQISLNKLVKCIIINQTSINFKNEINFVRFLETDLYDIGDKDHESHKH